MLKLKLQYFGHLMRRAYSFEKTLMLGKIEGRRRRGWQRMRWLDGITDSMDMTLGKLRELVTYREAWRGVWFMGSQKPDRTEWLNWTEVKKALSFSFKVTMFLHYLWVGPLQAIAVTALLWMEIGISCLAGIAVLIILLLLQSCVGNSFSSLR